MTVNRFIGCLCCLLVACQGSSDQAVGAITFDRTKVDALDSLFLHAIDQKKIPGAVALVAQSGNIVYHKALGKRDVAQGEAQTTQDIFRLASMTKPITAVAAMMLYEEGKFQLDDLLSQHIPNFQHPQILDSIDLADSSFTAHPAENEITIRQLFTHSSGIGYGFQDDNLMAVFEKAGITEGFEERDILLQDNVLNIAQMPLLHEPGDRFTYGLSTDVLGYLVEIWSGMPLDQFFRDQIFTPLGMKDTYFYLPEEKQNRLTKVYQSSEKGVVETDYPLIHYPVRGAKRYLSGGADLSGTAHDYYLFCQMLLNKGSLNGVRVLEEETVELMTTTHLETGDEDMGLGVGILSAKTASENKARSIGSYSWGGFFTTTFWIDPKEDLIAILLLQLYPFDDWAIQGLFEDIIYEH